MNWWIKEKPKIENSKSQTKIKIIWKKSEIINSYGKKYVKKNSEERETEYKHYQNQKRNQKKRQILSIPPPIS